jgi:hypothetical protein
MKDAPKATLRKQIVGGKVSSIQYAFSTPVMDRYNQFMKNTSPYYPPLFDYILNHPVIDCHDHSHENGPKFTDAIQFVIFHYLRSDLVSASSEAEIYQLDDANRSLEERWAILEPIWNRTCHTGYARCLKYALERFYGSDRLSLDLLRTIQANLLDLTDASLCETILDEAKIVARLQNIWVDARTILDKSYNLPLRSYLTIPLPDYHAITNYTQVQKVGELVGMTVTSLDEYLEACRLVFAGYQRFGAVAFKDQSAYRRTLEYGNPTRAEAESVFNWMMSDPRRYLSYPDGCRPLDDYLFNQFMRMARDMDLPVQIHTGHMAGIRNDVVKTNAIGLTNLIELHREVRFDLFHANWPYSGEILFLCKNYPNVSIDFCWTNIIDPIYSRDLFRQALASVPHGKIHAYGSDFKGSVAHAWAHARMAREHIASALADMVEWGYLDIDEAKAVAGDWLFNNPNRFFKLGLA